MAFTYLKQVLTSSPVVTLPNFALPFRIYIDASKDSVGAVLAQEVDISVILGWLEQGTACPPHWHLGASSACLKKL